jgi:hypothetical protein
MSRIWWHAFAEAFRYFILERGEAFLAKHFAALKPLRP